MSRISEVPPSTAYLNRSERLSEVNRFLADEYGQPIWHSHGPALDELIATVLSQHTSDSNTARSFAALRARFPTWNAVVAAPTGEVADVIRSGGLADIKAPRIQRILREVQLQTGDPSLEWLKNAPLVDARDWLVSLPGVGPKTAAGVLLFSMGLPAMPVDTHVHRVSRRLRFIEPRVSAEAAHDALEKLIGPNRDLIYALHLNLIQHGRKTCKSRRPACNRCCLSTICPSAHKESLGSR